MVGVTAVYAVLAGLVLQLGLGASAVFRGRAQMRGANPRSYTGSALVY